MPIKVIRQKEGGYLATSKSLQGVLAEGKTASEAISNAMDVASHIIEIRKEKGLDVPLKVLKKPRTGSSFSTKVSVISYA
jgi:predicted RNase H-like HicB family nuclease